MRTSIANLLSATIDCRPSEVRAAGLMFVHSFLLGVVWIFFETVADTLFLAQYGSHALPLAYLLTTVTSVVAALLYARLGMRLRLGQLASGLLGAFLVVLVLCRVGLLLEGYRPVVLAMRIAYWVMYMLGELEFWTLAGCLFDLRQSKRLFPLIASGEVLASVLGGFSVPLLSRFLAVADLLYLAMGGMALCVLLVVSLSRRYRQALAGTREGEHVAAVAAGPTPRLHFTSRYLILLLAVYGLYIFGWYFVDFSFYTQVERRYESDEQALAEFIGSFYAAAGAVQLVTQALLASWIISRFGLRVSLLALPVCLGLGAACMTLLNLVVQETAMLFWIMTTTKLFDMVLARALQEPSIRILYQPLPARQRPVFQTFTEGMFGTSVAGVTGIVLLLWTLLGDFSTLQASAFLLLIAVTWIVVSVALSRSYGAALQKSLARRRFDASTLSVQDASSRRSLQQWLQSPNPTAVIYALEVLDEAPTSALEQTLIRLLDHPAAEVRREVLLRIERHQVVAARGRVEQMIQTEPKAVLQGLAVRVRIALGEHEAVPLGETFLRDPSAERRQGALVGLLRHGGIDGVLSAGTDLLRLAASADVAERQQAARVLGEVGLRLFYRPLLGLLTDPDLAVRRCALLAAVHVSNLALLPALLGNLTVPSLSPLAVSALAAGGQAFVPALEDALDQPGRPSSACVLIVRACQHIGGEAVIRLLRKRMDQVERRIRRQILTSLLHLGYVAEGEERAAVTRMIRRDCGRAASCLAALLDVGPTAADLVASALAAEVQHNTRAVFVLLSFLYPSPVMANARMHLEAPSPQKRALAVEFIDQLLPRDFKALVLPLVEDLPPPARLQRLLAYFPQEARTGQQHLEQLLAEEWIAPWTRAAALYHVGRAGWRELLPSVRRHLDHTDRLVAETAEWGQQRLVGETPGAVQPQVLGAEAPVYGLGTGWRDTMLLTIERVLFLKQVEMFSDIDADALVHLASTMQEQDARPGEVIIHEGELGRELFIVSAGKVRIHKGDVEITTLGETGIFGELAALDPQPRTASVTALKETHLLRLDHATLFDELTGNIELAQGIIRFLVQRFRERR